MRILSVFTLLLSAFALFGCQQTSNKAAKGSSPQAIMVMIAKQAQNCWFKNNDKAFMDYKLATELNSHAGRPRILIVPKNNPAGLPKLVIQAERIVGISGVSTFGPLLDTSDGARIQDSVSRWAAGSKSC